MRNPSFLVETSPFLPILLPVFLDRFHLRERKPVEKGEEEIHCEKREGINRRVMFR